MAGDDDDVLRRETQASQGRREGAHLKGAFPTENAARRRGFARRTRQTLPATALTTLMVAVATATPAPAVERGVITGRVINETTGKPAQGALIRLSGADDDGSGREARTTEVGADGRYRFDDLPSGTDWLYVVDAEFDGGLFPGSTFGFPVGEKPKLESSLKVWNTTTDPNAILVTRDAMFVLAAENEVGVVESVNVMNHSHLAYIGRGGETGTAETTFGFGLPAGASGVRIENASLDVPELVETDFGFGITVALPPGESSFTYSYRVPADGATYILSKTALYPTADLLAFVGEPLELDSDRMQETETVTVEGQTYQRWETTDTVDAGDTLLIQVVAQAEIAWLPFAIGGAIVLLSISAAYIFTRRRQRRTEPVAEESRDDLIAAIASLDVAYESGSIAKEDWESTRTQLKTRLVELEQT